QLSELATTAKSSQAKVHALHLLEAFKKLDNPAYDALLADADPRVRDHVVWDPPSAADPDPRVRFSVALTREKQNALHPKPQALVRILEQDLADPWTRTAVLIASWD